LLLFKDELQNVAVFKTVLIYVVVSYIVIV